MQADPGSPPPVLSRTRVVAIAATLALVVLVGGLVAIGAQTVSAASSMYVATWGSDAGPGTAGQPFRTIGEAVAAAPSGSTVTVRGGRYHESVQIYGKALRLAAAAGEQVVLDGTVDLSGWTASGGDWYVGGWTAQFDVLTGLVPGTEVAGYSDEVFLDGIALRQVLSRDSVQPGTFFHDRPGNRLWIGSDPSGRAVEASDLPWALYFNHADGSSLSGVTVRRYATPASDVAAVRIYSNNVTVDSSVVDSNAYAGISVMGDGVTIRSSTFADNGYLGVHGFHASNFLLASSTVVGNNTAGFDKMQSAGGIKLATSNHLTFDRNYVAFNAGPGLWTDIGSSNIVVSNNLLENNQRSGIQIELSGQVVVAGNISLNNGETGLWILESNDVGVWNNATYGNLRDIWVEDGPRSSPDANSTVNWDLNRVTIRNNILGRGRIGEQALLNVDDWTQHRSAQAMAVTSDWNAFWLPSGSATPNIARWALWPSPLAVTQSIGDAQAATGQEAHSTSSSAASNPFATNEGGYDFRVPVGQSTGTTPPPDVAAVLGSNAPIVGPAVYFQPPRTPRTMPWIGSGPTQPNLKSVPSVGSAAVGAKRLFA